MIDQTFCNTSFGLQCTTVRVMTLDAAIVHADPWQRLI
jgi:hypothetical protein